MEKTIKIKPINETYGKECYAEPIYQNEQCTLYDDGTVQYVKPYHGIEILILSSALNCTAHSII